MPAHLMGLLAIGTFYLITVVVGMCATRCLTDDEADDDSQMKTREDEGGGEDTLHLLRLLEQSLPGMRQQADSIPPMSPLQLFSASASFEQASHDTVLLAPNGRNRQRSDDADHIVLDTTTPNHDGMSASASVPTHLADARSQHTITGMLPPIVAGRGPTSYDQLSLSSSQPPPLPPGGRYLLADRNIGWLIGSLSMLAIKTGGVFPAAIAEQTFDKGLLWCQLPVAEALSVIVGGTLFAKAMYAEGFVTVIDPFQQVYGGRIAVLLFIPIVIADLFYACAIMSSLGSLQHMALGVEPWIGVLGAAAALLSYLLIGGFYAGTFTDSLQYAYLLLGMLMLTPAIWWSQRALTTETIFAEPSRLLGSVNGQNSGLYIDQMVMLILGGVPMQSYLQRMFSCRSSRVSNRVTVLSAIGCLLTGVPSMLIGVAAHSIEWSNTTLGATFDATNATAHLTLPYALSHAVPSAVKMVALGALTSGLLASCDSAIFGLATILAHNFYRGFCVEKTSSSRLTCMTRIFTLSVTAAVTAACAMWPHWHQHWMLPFDILYVFVFPQLFCVVYFKYANSYGAMFGLWTSVLVRLSLGEKSIGAWALLRLPFYTEADGQLFPYRTLAMLANLLTIIIVSLICEQLYKLGVLPSSQNMCVRRRPTHDRIVADERHHYDRRHVGAHVTHAERRRRVTRYVSEQADAVDAQMYDGVPTAPAHAAKPMTISSLYRHAAERHRRQSPLIERMTVL